MYFIYASLSLLLPGAYLTDVIGRAKISTLSFKIRAIISEYKELLSPRVLIISLMLIVLGKTEFNNFAKFIVRPLHPKQTGRRF